MNNFGIIIFKPGCPTSEIEEFRTRYKRKGSKILKETQMILSKEAVIAIYPNIFSFTKDDLKYGLSWKQQTIRHLTSGTSICFLVQCHDAQGNLSKYKYLLRNRYGKITHPKAPLNSHDFFNLVIKNLVHVFDEKELQIGIWLLF